jgi:hypothetical protein
MSSDVATGSALVSAKYRVLVPRRVAMVRPTLRTSGAMLSMPRSPRASVLHCAVASIASTVTPSCGARVSLMNTTAQPARALNRSAVGLGALIGPAERHRHVFVPGKRAEPCSVTALLPSARAITVGFPLALSGSELYPQCVPGSFAHLPFFIGARRYCRINAEVAGLVLEKSILCAISK